MYYVYVLKSKRDGQLYLGSTNDLRRRLAEHNSGLVFSTKTRTPFELVYYEAYKAERDARMRESNLKRRRQALAQLKGRIRESLGGTPPHQLAVSEATAMPGCASARRFGVPPRSRVGKLVRGQAIVEYMIVLTAIVLALQAFVPDLGCHAANISGRAIDAIP